MSVGGCRSLGWDSSLEGRNSLEGAGVWEGERAWEGCGRGVGGVWKGTARYGHGMGMSVVG